MSSFVFTNQNSSYFTNLYSTDGTASGTAELDSNVILGSVKSTNPSFTSFNGKLYLLNNADYYDGHPAVQVISTDGSFPGTEESFIAGPYFFPDALEVVNGKLLAAGEPIAPQGAGSILASNDGTNFNGIAGVLVPSPDSFIAEGKLGLFAGTDYPSGVTSLYRTDGTAAGTYDITPSSVTLNPTDFISIGGGKTVFVNEGTNGAGALWVTDGTSAGTHEIVNAALGTQVEVGDGGAAANGKAIFTAVDASGNISSWASDGTSAGTVEIRVNGPSTAPVRYPAGYVSFGNKVAFNTGYGLSISDGTRAGTVEVGAPLASVPQDYVAVGSRLFITATNASGVSSLYVNDGTASGTVAITVPGLSFAIGDLTAIGNGAVFVGEDKSGQYAFFSSDGTSAGSKELALPASVSLWANSLLTIAALPTPTTTPPAVLTAVLPNPLHTGAEAITGTGGVAGLQLERITQGTYNTPGETGWVKATVRANGTWSAILNFDKPGLLAHVYAENGGSTKVVDLVDGMPVAATNPTPPFTGVLPVPLYTGAETVTGTGGVRGLRLERITQGSYNTPGQAGWVTATVGANGTWSAVLDFDKPGMLAHVYAQNGGSGSVVDLVNGTPSAAPASKTALKMAVNSVAGSIANDMAARTASSGSAGTLTPPTSMATGSLPSVLSPQTMALVATDHATTTAALLHTR